MFLTQIEKQQCESNDKNYTIKYKLFGKFLKLLITHIDNRSG
jgi:hypothetical protein